MFVQNSVAFWEVLIPNHSFCQTILSCLSPHNHHLATINLMKSKPLSELAKPKLGKWAIFWFACLKFPQ